MELILTPKVENVKLLDKFNARASPMGTLYVTTTHLIFVSSGPSAASANEVKKELWMLHTLMSSIEKPLLTTSGTQLRIVCSHFQTATFIIQRDRDAHDVYCSILALSKPTGAENLFCFSYSPKGEVRQSTGWQFHDLQAEFQRQGVPNDNWGLCNLNEKYGLCATYPKRLFVPTKAPQSVIEGSARFRSKSRLPVLTYLHKNGAAIVRCAQPLVGVSGSRSPQDEQYVEWIRRATPNAGVIHVIDTRPHMNAMANKAGGKGYESEKFYNNIVFSFKGIENIHKMRASLRALTAAVAAATAEGFMAELGNSGWLKHVKAVLDSSVAIMQGVSAGRSVIVHCSDGWDRTAQTCSLAELMLDGYYRTVTGFQGSALVEKDWLAFGHKFMDRCGHIDGDPNEVSPTFAQFLDCVWQLTQLYPKAFQFNENYLLTIHEHVYSCQYGTFIGNCEREREALRLSEKTYSLWGYLIANNDEFTNPLYESSTQGDVLRPQIAPQSIRFWSGLYCRFEDGAHPVIDLLALMQQQTSSLEDHGRQLTKTIGQMTQLIAKSTAGSKASGAVRKMLPTSPTKTFRSGGTHTTTGTEATEESILESISHPLQSQSDYDLTDDDIDEIERKFANLDKNNEATSKS